MPGLRLAFELRGSGLTAGVGWDIARIGASASVRLFGGGRASPTAPFSPECSAHRGYVTRSDRAWLRVTSRITTRGADRELSRRLSPLLRLPHIAGSVVGRSTRALGIIMRASWRFEVRIASIVVAALVVGCASGQGASRDERAPSTATASVERPTYPVPLRNTGLSGRVVAHVYVEASGTVTNVKIIQSPHELFSEEVVAKLKKWKYTPQPKSFIAEYVFDFREQ